MLLHLLGAIGCTLGLGLSVVVSTGNLVDYSPRYPNTDSNLYASTIDNLYVDYDLPNNVDGLDSFIYIVPLEINYNTDTGTRDIEVLNQSSTPNITYNSPTFYGYLDSSDIFDYRVRGEFSDSWYLYESFLIYMFRNGAGVIQGNELVLFYWIVNYQSYNTYVFKFLWYADSFADADFVDNIPNTIWYLENWSFSENYCYRFANGITDSPTAPKFNYLYSQASGYNFSLIFNYNYFPYTNDVGDSLHLRIYACLYNYANSSFNNGYNVGFNDGVAVGRERGYQDGYQVGWGDSKNYWYQIAYDKGRSDATPLEVSFLGILGAIADTPVMIIHNLFSFDVFGISALTIFMSLLTGIVVIHFIRKGF